MARPVNHYRRRGGQLYAQPYEKDFYPPSEAVSAFEQGVDTGRKWGHEEMRERIERLYQFHILSEPPSDTSGLVHRFVKELLSGGDIE